MSRPRLGVGTFGEFGYARAASGRVTARTRHRGWDGTARLVQATGATRLAAERALDAFDIRFDGRLSSPRGSTVPHQQPESHR